MCSLLKVYLFVILVAYIGAAPYSFASSKACNKTLSKKVRAPGKWRQSAIEREIEFVRSKTPEGWAKNIKHYISELEKRRPKLATTSLKAWKQRWEKGKDSLLLTNSHQFNSLPGKMQNFLKGPWLKTLGQQGLA